jgi:ferrous iron transport protein B
LNKDFDVKEKDLHKHIAIDNKILLMGNPNVGKSVFFSQITGMDAISSNFSGTTVSYTQASMDLSGKKYTLIDVPGVFSLTVESQAEEVANIFLNSKPDGIICVLDATNLQRSIELALELKEYDIPIVFALNFMDVAKEKGIEINTSLLSTLLGTSVIETVAVKNKGIEELKQALYMEMYFGKGSDSCGSLGCSGCDTLEAKLKLYQTAKEITEKVRKTTTKLDKNKEKISNLMVTPKTGIPIALVIMAVSIGLIVGGGKALRAFILLPLVNDLVVPFFRCIISSIISEGIIHNILVGEYGIFVIGFEWPFALILPYVFLFYIVFSFLEDLGYLPRLGILFDNIMSKFGLQGGSIINIIMGFGCAVPAIIGTRTCTSKKERLLVTTLVCFTVPCISQTGALMELISSKSVFLFIPVIAISLAVFVFIAMIGDKLIKGRVDPMIIQVPNLLVPNLRTYGKKLTIRMKHFMSEAFGAMLIAIVIASVFKETGMLDLLAKALSPVIQGWLGLPRQAVDGLILGIVRREMSIAPLVGLDLTALQVLTASLVSLFYLPCISVFGILASEFNARTAVLIGVTTTVFAIIVGGIVNNVGMLFM